MGKVFVEKLLRRTDVGQIYMLMRLKKGKIPQERLVDMFNNPVTLLQKDIEPNLLS